MTKEGLHYEVESNICAADPPGPAGIVPGHAPSDVSGRLLHALHPAGRRPLDLSPGYDLGTRRVIYDCLQSLFVGHREGAEAETR